jgi:hypothetical protein
MEESHAKGVGHQFEKNSDRAVFNAAHTLEEAWAWGFETDIWRAHLTALTWPEVLRQVAIAAGHGRRRPNSALDGKQLVGHEGEDIVENTKAELSDPTSGAEAASASAEARLAELELRLRRPVRLRKGSLKASAWLILTRSAFQISLPSF